MNEWPHRWFGFWSESPQFSRAPSLKEWVSRQPPGIPEKDRVLSFLEAGACISVSTARYPRCLLCGQMVNGSFAYMSDGHWIWNNFLVHEVRDHDVPLPGAFLDHMRGQEYEIKPPDGPDDETLIRALDWSMLPDSPGW